MNFFMKSTTRNLINDVTIRYIGVTHAPPQKNTSVCNRTWTEAIPQYLG
jgi:hypothetical protein